MCNSKEHYIFPCAIQENTTSDLMLIRALYIVYFKRAPYQIREKSAVYVQIAHYICAIQKSTILDKSTVHCVIQKSTVSDM